MLIHVLAALSFACTDLSPPQMTDFAPWVDGAVGVPIDARLEADGQHSGTFVATVEEGTTGPQLEVVRLKDDYSGDVVWWIEADADWLPNTTYRVEAYTWGTDSAEPDLLVATTSFTTGDTRVPLPSAPSLLAIEAGKTGEETNDCVTGTHHPRDLVVEIDLGTQDQHAWVQLRNDDLRKWVARPVGDGGVQMLDVFQPVTAEGDRVNCFTATIVSGAGVVSEESPQLCIEDTIDGDGSEGCGCDTLTTPWIAAPWLLLPLLIRRRR
ncbi:MAG: hypothetical protein GWP91_02905 [Rhodobacterales bacterium]|nr:hypothetical protein [Rhodobacterales bacterium]